MCQTAFFTCVLIFTSIVIMWSNLVYYRVSFLLLLKLKHGRSSSSPHECDTKSSDPKFSYLDFMNWSVFVDCLQALIILEKKLLCNGKVYGNIFLSRNSLSLKFLPASCFQFDFDLHIFKWNIICYHLFSYFLFFILHFNNVCFF